jgi:flagellar motility protein MotE (MotC chaperone)
MADEPTAQHGFSAYSAGVVIEAAPMTTAEIAAQAREDQSAQRARKDEEMEGEKEDAARQLEEEFDEMEGLEERYKKLREQREALRRARSQTKVEDVVHPVAQPEDAESDSDDEEWDDWRFHSA